MGWRCWSLGLLPLVLGLQINQADSSPANKTIRIGYLLRTKARAGAINVAIERAQKDGFLRDYNFRYLLHIIIMTPGIPHACLKKNYAESM